MPRVATISDIIKVYRPRNPSSHKGDFGHTLLIGGSIGKMGAIQLASNACLRTGAGLTTACIPQIGYPILQSSLPEVMVELSDNENHVHRIPDLKPYNALGVGPGLGTHEDSQFMIRDLLKGSEIPMVIDADGLNCIAKNPGWLNYFSPGTILTPHPKEFDRLFGDHQTEEQRLATAEAKAAAYSITIVLKSHHTHICLANGTSWQNSTGNVGLAKGGSGDVLTGVIASLLGQKYSPADAALLGVFIHGLAADQAAKAISNESMIASDVIHHLSDAFMVLKNNLAVDGE